MSYLINDTIAAVATAPGGAARGMVRISGPEVVQVVAKCFLPENGQSLRELRRATVVPGQVRIALRSHALNEGRDGTLRARSKSVRRATHAVPCDLFIWPTSRSYTRQPVAELHTLAAPPVMAAVLEVVCEAGARLAEPGEFTLRAFLSGRIDLTQAEAVLGVIDAREENDLATSLTQLAGGLAQPMNRLREQLLQLLAELEAGLDFVEEDIEFISREELVDRLEGAAQLLGDIATQAASRMTNEAADQVVLIGPPNVGKSRLFNTLANRYGLPTKYEQARSTALVSSIRGTTRDYLTSTILLDGVPCLLVDTAGIEDTQLTAPPLKTIDKKASIDSLAQALTSERRSRATIRVWCSDISEPSAAPTDCDLIVLTKADLHSHSCGLPHSARQRVPVVVTSSHTDEGITALCLVLRQFLTREPASCESPILATTAHRCQDSIRLAERSLRRAVDTARVRGGDELIALEIRAALAELGKIVGTVYTDDLLDRIFSSFCIGK